MAGPGSTTVMLGQRWDEDGLSEVTPEEHSGVLGADGNKSRNSMMVLVCSEFLCNTFFYQESCGEAPFLRSSLHPASG